MDLRRRGGYGKKLPAQDWKPRLTGEWTDRLTDLISCVRVACYLVYRQCFMQIETETVSVLNDTRPTAALQIRHDHIASSVATGEAQGGTPPPLPSTGMVTGFIQIRGDFFGGEAGGE